MSKHLSAEQIAARDARRAKVRELAKEVSALKVQDRIALAARYGIRTIEGRELSLYNQCLIALQNPRASVVGGFRQWLKAGRAVRKGEHGCGIWVPVGAPKDDSAAAPVDDVRFVVGTVFDIAQTEPTELVPAGDVTSGWTVPFGCKPPGVSCNEWNGKSKTSDSQPAAALVQHTLL